MTIKKYVLWCVYYSFILMLQPAGAVDKSFLINEYTERFNKNPQKTAFQIMDEARLFITKASAFADPKTVYTNSDITDDSSTSETPIVETFNEIRESFYERIMGTDNRIDDDAKERKRKGPSKLEKIDICLKGLEAEGTPSSTNPMTQKLWDQWAKKWDLKITQKDEELINNYRVVVHTTYIHMLQSAIPFLDIIKQYGVGENTAMHLDVFGDPKQSKDYLTEGPKALYRELVEKFMPEHAQMYRTLMSIKNDLR